MTFTLDGMEWVHDQMLAGLRDGSLCVGNGSAPVTHEDEALSGDQTADTQIESVNVVGQIVENGTRRLGSKWSWSNGGVA